MSIATFIPTVWAARLLAHMGAAHVVAKLVNRDYEGEITQYGDSVKINDVGQVTVKDYVTNTDMDDPETLATADLTLAIDQQKYFNFQIDDVDKAQARGGLADRAMQEAAYALNDVTDKWLAALMAAGADAGNKLGTVALPVALDKDNAYLYLVRLKVLLDENNVPEIGRWALIPPAFHGLLLQDNRFVGTGGTAAELALGRGYIGTAAGFTLYMSNNLPYALGVYQVIASYNGSTSFAEQVLKNEAYRLEKRFSDGMKGLHVYGGKVLRPKKIAVLTATFDAGFLKALSLTSVAGTSTGDTKVVATPAIPTGYTAVFKADTAMTVPQYNAELTTGWTAWNGTADITAATGKELVVAYIDSANKAKAAGKVTVVAKA